METPNLKEKELSIGSDNLGRPRKVIKCSLDIDELKALAGC